MAGFFTADEIAMLRGSSVRFATLAELEFTSGTERLFAGAGTRVFAGSTWKGIGGLISIEGLAEQRGGDANQVMISLSGTDPTILPKAIAEDGEVENRPIVIFLQFLDGDEQPVGRLIPIYFGLMRKPLVDRDEMTETVGPSVRVKLPCETLMGGRSRPPFGRYTHLDQQQRHPDDKFFDRIGDMKGKTVKWPIATG